MSFFVSEDVISKRLGFDYKNMEQGSVAWFECRLGVITGSGIHNVISRGKPSVPRDRAAIQAVADKFFKLGIIKDEDVYKKIIGKESKAKGAYSSSRKQYMLELVAEVCTKQSASSGGRSTNWGHEHEEIAREIYEARNMLEVDTASFIYKDESMRCGVSPDGLIGEKGGLEIKCPYTTVVHLETVINEKIKPDYISQMDFFMWVTGREWVDFESFDPRMMGDSKKRIHVIRRERQDEKMKLFDEEVPKFIDEMDLILKKLGVEFGQQWD